jgi:thioredoxin 1
MSISNEEIVIFNFYANWNCMECDICKHVEKVIESIKKEVNAKIIKLNIDECSTINKKYEINSVPTIILFKNGNFIKKITDNISKENLLNILK